MPSTAGSRRPKVRPQNISLLPTDHAALRLLAGEERNGNISAAVARMIDRAMTERHGTGWRDMLPFGRETRDNSQFVAR